MHKYNTPGFDSRSLGFLFCLSLFLTIILSGCGVSVYKQHPALQLSDDIVPANVYFIRPSPLKRKGIADNKISINYDGQRLLKIAADSYTLLKIKPGKGEITTNSKTFFTNQRVPINVSRSRLYTFVSGGTYFIYLNRINEEFRGIFYDPQPVDLATAKSLVQFLHASGSLTRKEPIDAIEEVAPVPLPLWHL